MTAKLHVLDHPVLQYKLAQLRDEATKTVEFRRIIHEISALIAYEATRTLPIHTKPTVLSLESLEKAATVHPVQFPVIVAVMRAGNAMLDAVLTLLPESSVGHIGIYRDRFTLNTVEYYLRLPPQAKHKTILLLDPIVATGDTALACIERLLQFEVGAINILCLLISRQGVDKIHHYYPNVDIYALQMEPELNEKGFLVPGIGDVSNRLCGIVNVPEESR